MEKVYNDLDDAAGSDYRLFWRLLHSRQTKTKTFCDTLNVGNACYDSPEDVSVGFRNYYVSILNATQTFTSTEDELFYHTIENQTRDYCFEASQTRPVLEQPITVTEVLSVIKSLKRNKAPGHDMIQNKHFIYGGRKLAITLTELFNRILQTESIPDSWKHGIIVPLYKGKGKDKRDPNSYRPVSLTPCFSKVFEKILLERTLQFISDEKFPFPCPQQQGFQKQLSCITAAFNLQETICANLVLHSNVYAAFLDTEKAFDTVWHSGLYYVT